MLADEPVLKDMYDDFIVKAMDYAVTGVTFVAYTTRGNLFVPRYIPADTANGLEALYDPVLGHLASSLRMNPNDPHPYIQGRIRNDLSLRALDAYREVFDGNGRAAADYKILPVHSVLKHHLDDPNDMYFHPLGSAANAQAFLNQNMRIDNPPSVDTKTKRLIFFAETLGNQIYARYNGPVETMTAFSQSITDHCMAAHAVARAHKTLCRAIEVYI